MINNGMNHVRAGGPQTGPDRPDPAITVLVLPAFGPCRLLLLIATTIIADVLILETRAVCDNLSPYLSGGGDLPNFCSGKKKKN